jgi:tRNA dimethylallyltransferase
VSGARVIGLLGPTGVGKTAVAAELAGLLGTRIVSCDSMQVYAGFRVLTNQPWAPRDRGDLHTLVGFLDPGETMSAGEYAKLAQPLIEEELAEHGWALVVGGSGLYMRAALAPLAATGPVDVELRGQLEERARSQGAEGLHAELARLDADAAASIDHRNVRRVIRALEAVHGGERWSGREDLWKPAYYRPTLIVGLSMDRAVLAERIRARTAMMLAAGAVEEVSRFRDERGDAVTRPGRPGISCAIGYEQIWEYLAQEQGLAETEERLSAATRGYARRQYTWLRKVRDTVMIETEGRDPGDIARQIVALADRAGRTKESNGA